MNQARVSSFATAPGDLRQIVLDYLCDNCCVDTATVFARDSSTRELDKDGDEVITGGENNILDPQVIRDVQLRKEIRTLLCAGRIDDATKMIKLLYPTVLGMSVASTSKVALGTPSPGYNSSTIALNLKIQDFIEQSRTVPLPWPEDISFNDCKPGSDSALEHQNATKGDVDEEARQTRLLTLMQNLRIETNALPDAYRKIYLEELLKVGGLLAYRVPEKSKEMRKYLDMARREAVAEQINEVILCRSDTSRFTTIDRISRQATWVFSILRTMNVPLPPPDQRPSGIDTTLNIHAAPVTDSKDFKSSREKESQERFPLFELETFLGSE